MVLALSLLVLSQVAVEHQPDQQAMLTALNEARAKRPRDAKALVALKQGPIDGSLGDDLKTRDWFLAGAWSYPETKFGPGYDAEDPIQYDFIRYGADGGELRYTSNLSPTGQRQITHVNFTLPVPTAAALKRIGKQVFLEVTAYGEKEYLRVVQYQNGVLVLDITYDGKTNSKRLKFRDVRVAMPRLFESEGH